MKIYRLQDIADIKAGYPFRGQIQNKPSGVAKVIQMKHITQTKGVSWDDLIITNLQGRRNPDWLEKNDIVFAARGNNNFATCLENVNDKVVCSPHFFQIHVHKPEDILPRFIAWFINQRPAQQYLMSSAEGTMIRSIRRGILESLTIVVPELKIQKQIVNLDNTLQREQEIMDALKINMKQTMNGLAQQLIRQSRST